MEKIFIKMHVDRSNFFGQAMGGDFWSGAIGACVAELAAPSIMRGAQDAFGRVVGSSIVGGIASWASGGSFYNGAMAGGFGMLFNELGHMALSGQRTPNGNNNDNRGINKQNVNKMIRVANKGIDFVNSVGVAEIYFDSQAVYAIFTQNPVLFERAMMYREIYNPVNIYQERNPIPHIPLRR